MSEEHRDEPGDAQQQGVFGNLPGSRPGTRSPRRDAGAARAGRKPRGARPAPAAKPASARAEPGSAAEPAATSAGTRSDREPADPPANAADAEGGPGLEDLAWAGVAAAAEAATLGVRLASRAMEALRDTAQRR